MYRPPNGNITANIRLSLLYIKNNETMTRLTWLLVTLDCCTVQLGQWLFSKLWN